LQVAVKFSLIIFRHELPQIPLTLCVIFSKIALKQVLMTFGTLEHCQTIVSQAKNVTFRCLVFYNL